MEPLTTAAIAIGSVVATKALEKTGEKVTETLWEQTGKFLNSLKQQSPDTVTVIEKALEEPFYYRPLEKIFYAIINGYFLNFFSIK